MLSESRRMILVKKRGNDQPNPSNSTQSNNPILDYDHKPFEPSLSISQSLQGKVSTLFLARKTLFSGLILIWMFHMIKKFMLEANLEHTVYYTPRARKISKQVGY